MAKTDCRLPSVVKLDFLNCQTGIYQLEIEILLVIGYGDSFGVQFGSW